MNVTLIHCQSKSKIYGALPPLGLLAIASFLKRKDINPILIDFSLIDKNIFDIDDIFQKSLPDSSAKEIIGISCDSIHLPIVVRELDAIKHSHPNAIIVLGGRGPASFPDIILNSFPNIDFIAPADGTEGLYSLIKNYGKPVQHPGLVSRRNLDSYPFQQVTKPSNILNLPLDFSLLPLKEYDNVGIITSLGCDFKCAFCDTTHHWKHHHYERKLDVIESEILQLTQNYGIKKIGLLDDNFTQRLDRIRDFLKIVKKIDLAWSITGFISANLEDDLLAEMGATGCYSMFLPLDTGSARILQSINRKISLPAAYKKLELVKKHISRVRTNLMWGFPTESLAEFKQTLAALFKCYILDIKVTLGLVTPLPRARLTHEYFNQLIESPNVWKYSYFGLIDIKDNEMVQKIIKTYPRLFPFQYRYPTPEFEKKVESIQGLETIAEER